ncbi:hypothetical protein Dimus_009476 [Dionaea muscipula]
MDRRFRSSMGTFLSDLDDPQTSSENGSDTPVSGDDSRATATAASPTKKSRRSIKKRMVSVPIADLDGSRTKGESYPPSDSWAWRKYGQKPIKGSPYPRGYYRCSSSKGCPARKQVERSRVDPTMLLITYAYDHNHSFPATKHHHHHSAAGAGAARSPPGQTTSPPSEEIQDGAATVSADIEAAEAAASPSTAERVLLTDFGGEPSFMGIYSGEFMSWLSDVSYSFEVVPDFVGPSCEDSDVAMMAAGPGNSMREEDESMFADLDELPECSAVFKRGSRGFIQRCRLGAAAPLCGSTG